MKIRRLMPQRQKAKLGNTLFNFEYRKTELIYTLYVCEEIDH